MSRVSYFQRYAKAENHATNNTLLALSHFHRIDRHKLQGILTALLEEEVTIGLTFEQQVKTAHGVPDALIMQQPLRLFVEAKHQGPISAAQIRNHVRGIADSASGGRDVLLALTRDAIPESEVAVLASEARGHGVTFSATTFSQLVEAMRMQCADYDRELGSIVDDYESYLLEENLLDQRNRWLPVFPCGTSIEENARFGVYYEPPARPCKRNYRFIATYTKKTISYVGMVEAITVLSYEGDKPTFTNEVGTLTEDHRARIEATVAATPYYHLKEAPIRFYVVDAFLRTGARKTSPGGIMGLRYLDLCALVPGYDMRRNYTSQEIADALSHATWD